MKKHIAHITLATSVLLGCQSDKSHSGDPAEQVVATGDEEGQGNVELEAGETKKSERIKPESWRVFFQPASAEAEIQASGPGAAASSLEDARKAIAQGQYEDAESLFLGYIRENEDAHEARLELVQLYLRINNAKKAWPFLEETRVHLEKSEKHNPELNFKYRYVLALAHLRQQNNEKAKKILSGLIAEDKTFIPAYALLASHYLGKGKVSIAEYVAKQGIDRGGEEERLTNLLGSVSTKLGKHQDALHWFERSLKHAPGYAPALMNRASLHMTRGDLELAQKDLGAIESSHANNPSYCLLRGILYMKQNQDQLARATLERALQLDPENPHVRYHLAFFYEEKMADNAQALKLYQEAMQLADEESPLQELAEWHVRSLATREFAQAYLR